MEVVRETVTESSNIKDNKKKTANKSSRTKKVVREREEGEEVRERKKCEERWVGWPPKASTLPYSPATVMSRSS